MKGPSNWILFYLYDNENVSDNADEIDTLRDLDSKLWNEIKDLYASLVGGYGINDVINNEE